MEKRRYLLKLTAPARALEAMERVRTLAQSLGVHEDDITVVYADEELSSV